ncbi:MAG: exopolysaccharide biosynthesis polyprenyl glycosylphosphotransferase [Candidatus Niyogibacteria bacterium]|nr:exopolysaccharide biosynthesis polyprenyl glycosylphosphotransferase [Candidatus Niyogibacteria bacterium]
MLNKDRLRKIILLLGDLGVFYLALWLALTLRYSTELNARAWELHIWPFLIVFALWLAIFYIFGLYDLRLIAPKREGRDLIAEAFVVAGGAAVALFYFVPFFGITPKTNLFLVIVFSALGVAVWRRIFLSQLLGARKVNTLFIGTDDEVAEIISFLEQNPQLGYQVFTLAAGTDLISTIKEKRIDLVVASPSARGGSQTMRDLYATLHLGITILDAAKFYESIVGKIPLRMINEAWFIDNLSTIDKKIFESLKRLFDIIGVLILGIPTLALTPLITLLIKLESSGPVLYRQLRVGRNNKNFEIVKFRSMRKDAETDGAKWASTNDARITKIGNILRKTRIDELPQLWNVLRGELSFIGPRPERPEFMGVLKKEIPHYEMRHLVKPGLSGWAQVNFPYGASVEDAREKMQYDLYYLKNRSLILDLVIALKTIATVLRHQGR